jgi:hypothetical protein
LKHAPWAEISPSETLIEVRVNGDATLGQADELWRDLVKLSAEYGCYKILGVSNRTTPVGVLEALAYADVFRAAGVSKSRHRVAWIEQNPANRDSVRLIQSALTNAGYWNALAFADEQEGREWVLSDEPAPL